MRSGSSAERLPVVEAVAAPLPTNRDGEQNLPCASAVLQPPGAISEEVIRVVAREEMEMMLKQEHKKNVDRFSSFQVAVMKDVNKSVCEEVAEMLQKYSSEDLPVAINSRVNVLFPRFLADSNLVKKHLHDHLRHMDDLVSSRKKDVENELETQAKSVAGGGANYLMSYELRYMLTRLS